jgi:hypothetical protein
MITNRQIARLWVGKDYKRLYRELMAARPEAIFKLDGELEKSVPVAALAMIRLDEMSQSYLPLFGQLLRAVLMAQEADGGWGDLATTALCIRALLCDQGDGQSIDRGLSYLANLQKTEGIWPAVPIRRMPEDAAVSLFILHQLGGQPRFRSGVRFADALEWLDRHQDTLVRQFREFWVGARLRCGLRTDQTHAMFAA